MKYVVLPYLAPEKLIALLKCFIYTGLCFNGYNFITEDLLAASQLLTDRSSFSDIINIFAVTIDTVAWISLLVVFELETAVLDDQLLRKKPLKWSLNTITACCYIFISYAVVGYVGKLIMLLDSFPYTLGNPCDLVNSDYVISATLDEYFAITAESCKTLDPAAMGQISGQPIIFANSQYGEIKALAWLDVINSAAWMLIVCLLQIDIILQLKGGLNKHIMGISSALKGFLYLTLFIMAVCWGVYGTFRDFSDALLWLLGFLIIELNIFNWQQEVTAELAEKTPPSL